MKLLLIILTLVVSWPARAQEFKVVDIYKFVTYGGVTVIWEFSDKVIRKTWREDDDTCQPIQQLKLIVTGRDVVFEDDTMVVIRFLVNDGFVDIVYSKQAHRYMFISDGSGEEGEVYYPIIKTIMPKKLNDIMSSADAQALKWLKKKYAFTETQQLLNKLNQLTDLVKVQSRSEVSAAVRNAFRVDLNGDHEAILNKEERA